MLRKTQEELFKAIQMYMLPPPCCRDSGICELKKGSISKETYLAQVPFEDYPEVERIFGDYIVSSVRRHSPKAMEGVWVDFWGDGKDTMDGPMGKFIKLSRLLEKVDVREDSTDR